MISPEIRSNPDELRPARLMLLVLLPSLLACVGLIVAGYLTKPDPLWAFLLILSGHILACGSIFLLRFCSTVLIPGRAIAVLGVLQLLSATVASGGMRSNVIFAYPILPIFLASLVGYKLNLLANFALLTGLFGIFWFDSLNPTSIAVEYNHWVGFATIAWCVLMVLGISVYARFQSAILVGQVQEELRQRKVAQEQLEAASRGKDRFLAYISHEIRNPLTTMVGAAELLEMGEHDPVRSRYLSALKSSADSMRDLVDRVLDFSQVESGRAPLQLEALPIKTFLTELTAQFSGSAESKGISLYCEISASAPAVVIADPLLLKQALSNLLSNAIKFSKPGGEVHLSVDRVGGDWERALLSVRDTGVGIPPVDQDRIFEPYQRHQGEFKEESGTGLGLPISHAILANMGTELRVESQVGFGSRFFFELVSAKTRMEESLVPFQSLEGQSVLVAEDQAQVAVVLLGMLSSLGCDVTLARDGEEALRLFKQVKPDSVLMDLRMPKLSGQEVAQRIRVYEQEVAQQACRIVAVTGEMAVDLRSQSSDFSAVLQKPVTPQELVDVFQ